MFVKRKLTFWRECFGVVAPQAFELTAFKKHGCSYSVFVMYGKSLYLYYVYFHQFSYPFFLVRYDYIKQYENKRNQAAMMFPLALILYDFIDISSRISRFMPSVSYLYFLIALFYVFSSYDVCKNATPIKYINNLKLSRAKELIVSDYYSIPKISELSGFGDESYFCRYFKKMTGMTATEYRQKKYL